MQSRSSSSRKDTWSLFLSYTLLGILLSVSACARIPNMVPDGYEYIVKYPAIASTLAQLDYPIVAEAKLTKNDQEGLDNPSSIGIHVTKNGERVWIFQGKYWSQELYKPITKVRFSLIGDGVTNAICTGVLKELEGDVTSVPCTSYIYHDLQQPFMVNEHLCKFLIGMLDYWVGAHGENDPATGTLTRPYVLIPDKPIPVHLRK